MSALIVGDLVLSPGGSFRTSPLDLTIDRGEILCLVGPSGCGKTTLIRALAGLLTPLAGTIELGGRNLNDPAVLVPAGKRRVGMVFQNLALWPHMKALAQVRYAAGRGAPEEKARELLAQVGLAGREGARPHQLSGGEGQRVALARALAGDPELILLDEPLRSVDPHLRADLGEMLRRLVRDKQVACLLVTHDRDEALALGDRIAVMRAGEFLSCGTPGELLEGEETHPFTRSFLTEGITPPPGAGDEGNKESNRPTGPGPATRLGLFLFTVVLAGAAALSFAGGPGVRPTRPTFTSSAQCEPCHQEVYKEWRISYHSKAWTDPEVRRLSNNFSNKQCLSCHTPQPILVTGIGERALRRNTLLKEGVNCFSCHQDAQGRIVGTRDIPSAPCRPVKNEAISTNGICAPCHNQHFTVDQWEESPAKARGEDCITCHMPEKERRLADGTTGKGRDHLNMGGSFPAYVRSAVALDVTYRDGRLIMGVKNVFGGHNFPTDTRHKASDLLVKYRQDGKWGPWHRVARFRNPYREEPGPNTQILAGVREEFTREPPPGADEALVRLDFRATPFVPDEGAVDWDQEKFLTPKRAIVLYRRSIDLK